MDADPYYAPIMGLLQDCVANYKKEVEARVKEQENAAVFNKEQKRYHSRKLKIMRKELAIMKSRDYDEDEAYDDGDYEEK